MAVLIGMLWELATRSTVQLIGSHMADDAFYYLVLADNAPLPVFNGSTVTTGFHPMWWVLLAPIGAVTDGAVTVRLVLLFVSVVHVTSGLVIHEVLRRWWSPGWVPALAAAVWMVHPGVRSIGLMGVESSVVALTLAILLLSTTRSVSPRSSMQVGACTGLCFLARTDALIVSCFVALAWLLSERASRAHVARAVGAAVAVATPWVLFLLAAGGLSQDSSRALRLVRDRLGSAQPVLDVMVPFIDTFTDLVLWPTGPGIGGPRLLGLVAVVLVCLVSAWRSVEVGLAVGVIAVHLVQASSLGAMREWYGIYWVFALSMLFVPRLVFVGGRMARRLGVGREVVALGACVTSTLVLALAFVGAPVWFPQEADKYRAGLLVGTQLDGDARVAAFNAGLYQWSMPQDVLNLDGVVNPDVLPALESGALCDFVRGRGVEWVIDSANGKAKADVFAPGLLVAGMPLELGEVNDPQYLWKVDPSTCEPTSAP